MLTIRSHQMAELELRALERIRARLQGTIARLFPHVFPVGGDRPEAAAPDLAQLVERGMESAVDHDLVTPGDWAAYIALDLALRRVGDGLTPDWVVDSLKDDSLPGPARLALVEHLLAEAGVHQPDLAQVCELMRRARSDTVTWASSTS